MILLILDANLSKIPMATKTPPSIYFQFVHNRVILHSATGISPRPHKPVK